MDRRIFVLGSLLTSGLFGCGQSNKYPQPKVTSALDRPGTCHHCGKAISLVTASNQITLKAAQYIVCGEKCAAGIKAWHESQFGK